MNPKYLLLLLVWCFSLFSIKVIAAQRTPQDAMSIAERIVSSNAYKQNFRLRSNQHVNLTIATQSEAYYVINIDDSGFFVISSDDELPELLGYSDKQNFSEANMPPALLMWLNNYDKEIQAWRKAKQQGVHISNSEHHALKSSTYIPPLITTEWGQDFPFNKYCPVDCQGRVCPTGCTTTAIAQILKYWQWPKRGFGSATCEYVCAEDATDTRILSVDMDSTYYQWEEMVNYYGLGSSASSYLTEPIQQEAVATLMYHIAVSQQVHFAYSGTGLDNAEIRAKAFPSLFDHFDYDDNIQAFVKDYCNLDSLENILYEELYVGRPIFVVGVDMSKGGHAFVCDGYDEHLFHFNWGWYGIGDGWFRLSALNPSINYSESFEFNSYLQFFTGIQPANNGLPISHQGQVLVADSIQVSLKNKDNDNIYYNAIIYGISNAGLKDYSDLFSFAIYPDNSDDVTQPLFIHHSWDFPGTGLNLFYGYQTSDVTCSISLNKKLPGGKYRIAAVYRNANGEWEPIPLLKGIQYDYINKLYGVMLGGPVTVYTLTGQPVMFIREWEGYNQLHQLNLPSGTYLLKQQNEVLKYLIY